MGGGPAARGIEGPHLSDQHRSSVARTGAALPSHDCCHGSEMTGGGGARRLGAEG
ncbi:hypothetical protein FM103_06295 [Corynebacterium xerosis]|nr:hypothetical protein FM103_06295 [Corynebacterium xerosis]